MKYLKSGLLMMAVVLTAACAQAQQHTLADCNAKIAEIATYIATNPAGPLVIASDKMLSAQQGAQAEWNDVIWTPNPNWSNADKATYNSKLTNAINQSNFAVATQNNATSWVTQGTQNVTAGNGLKAQFLYEMAWQKYNGALICYVQAAGWYGTAETEYITLRLDCKDCNDFYDSH